VKNKLLAWMDKKGGGKTESEIYQSRWVWYHTILAAELFLSNILLIGILVVLALK
jgi:hypothetical protein